MRLLFFGTPEFARKALEKLLNSRHQVAAVVTVPDKPTGRGRKIKMSEVKEYALTKNLEVLQPKKLKDELFLQQVKELAVDLFAVVAFRILPEKLFSIPQYGAINLHASLLPKFRGAAPIEHALMNGETVTGVTTFQIRKKVDTGGILKSREVPIKMEDTYEDLYPRLADIGADLLVETIDKLEMGDLKTQIQDDTLATPAPKIKPENSIIDWRISTKDIINQIRALAGSQDAYSILNGRRLKILRAQQIDDLNGDHQPGEIISANRKSGLIVAGKDGAVSLLEVCLEGKKRMTVTDFLNGMKIESGTILTAP